MTKTGILSTLDHCDDERPFNFINLGHPYVYLIDSRLNLFRDDAENWAIVSEVLGYNTRGADWAVGLEIRYFGNCLVNPETENEQSPNYYTILPIDRDNFNDTIDIETLKPDAACWLVRGVEIPLSHDKKDYADAGIELKEIEPGEIAGEEVARLAAQQYRHLFRATDEELRKSIPESLEKILVIDEWHHKEFHQSKSVFEDPAMLSSFDLGNDEVKQMIEQELAKSRQWNARQWENRPSSYETWQQIADVLVSGDPSFWKPTLEPNTHWKNWPEGGSM